MKSIKKVLASVLALAMVVTAVPATTAEAATTGVPKTKTYYAGKSYTLTLTTPKSWKSVKTTWSEKNSAISLSSKKTKSVKVKAIKATKKATVKVKVTFAKSSKKGAKRYTKNYKTVIKINNPSITTSVSSVTLAPGETTTVKATAKPSSAKISFSSADKNVATVSSTGVITGVATGTTEVAAKATYGTKTVTKKITVTVSEKEVLADGITTEVLNPISADYPDTVLVNQLATIKVKATKDGKPVANKTVVFTTTNGTGSDQLYAVKGYNSAITDANGVATFVIGYRYNDEIKASDEIYASVNYKVQVDSQVTTGQVSFATLSYSKIENVNNSDKDTTNDLVPGTNYTDKNYGNGIAKTASMDDPKKADDEYVESQQVSPEGKDTHKVIFTGGYPMITLPAQSAIESGASKGTEPIGYTANVDKTYDSSNVQYYKLKEDPSKLTYATLHFNKMSLSKYTCIDVETFSNEDDAKAGTHKIFTKTYVGPVNQSNFDLQVTLDESYKSGLWFKVTVRTAGQIDESLYAGYDLDRVDYVYKTQTKKDGTKVALKNATVTWEKVDTRYTDETTVTDTTVIDAVLGKNGVVLGNNETLTVKRPTFPQVGTAVFTHYDANGKIKAYYAGATENDGKNQNVLKPAGTLHAYKISEDELKDTGAVIEQDGKTVTVNAEKAGRTTLEGTVKVNGEIIKLDAENQNVYTTVQWNPIPTTETKEKEAFVALLGQNIDVIAQLVDDNGNAVSTNNVPITFKNDADTISDTAVNSTISKKTNDVGKATVVLKEKKTDAKGQAKLTLKSSELTELINISTEAGSVNGKKYNAVLKIADTETSLADLYWIDADLVFKPSASDSKKFTTSETNSEVTVKEGLDETVGQKWRFGVYTIGSDLVYYKDDKNQFTGKLAGASVNIENLGITMAKNAGGVGTVTAVTTGTVSATSDKNGITAIASRIDKNTLTTGTKVSKGIFAGTGAVSINKKLTLEVKWGHTGLKAAFVVPNGDNIYTAPVDDGPSIVTGGLVYVKVTDTLGNAVSGKSVTFKANEGDVVTSASVATIGSVTAASSNSGSAVSAAAITEGYKVYTNADGIAVVALSQAAVNMTKDYKTEVTAKVDALDVPISHTFTWVRNPDEDFVLNVTDKDDKGYITRYDYDTNKITLVFTTDIVPSSVRKEAFTVTYSAVNVASPSSLIVESAQVVNNNSIELSLGKNNITPQKGDTVQVGVNVYGDYDNDQSQKVYYLPTSTQGIPVNDGGVVKLYVKDDKKNPEERTNLSNAAAAKRAYDKAVSKKVLDDVANQLQSNVYKVVSNSSIATIADCVSTAAIATAGAITSDAIVDLSGSISDEFNGTITGAAVSAKEFALKGANGYYYEVRLDLKSDNYSTTAVVKLWYIPTEITGVTSINTTSTIESDDSINARSKAVAAFQKYLDEKLGSGKAEVKSAKYATSSKWTITFVLKDTVKSGTESKVSPDYTLSIDSFTTVIP